LHDAALVEPRGTIVTAAPYSIRSPKMALVPYSYLEDSATLSPDDPEDECSAGVRANESALGRIEAGEVRTIRSHVSGEHGRPLGDLARAYNTRVVGHAHRMAGPTGPDEVGGLIAFLSPSTQDNRGSSIDIESGTDSLTSRFENKVVFTTVAHGTSVQHSNGRRHPRYRY